ncbi:hypothetical protein F4212_04740 [Candidatus Poribacteria bacterium]|nr:hypothetical protein [Candidatus Poribacteria bacterium]
MCERMEPLNELKTKRQSCRCDWGKPWYR